MARKAPSIEDRFEFEGDGVVATARAELLATLYEVRDRQSGEFCLKLWRKTGTAADAELRELWRHEMRHVQRVMARQRRKTCSTTPSFRGLREVVEPDGLFCSLYTGRASRYFHAPNGEQVAESPATTSAICVNAGPGLGSR